ncbi:MAG TPA: phosphoserine transaminase [Acidimicrobiales bacterium]|nr:phosphoserine transaminase [Acidimicrobiales bacterium]
MSDDAAPDKSPLDIAVPRDLLPGDGRFCSGPSKVRQAQADAVAAAGATLLGTSHRQAPVKNLVGRVRDGLAALFDLPDGYEVLLANGGTTLFWDAATFGLVERKSQHLCFGEFSAKFAAAVTAAPHLDEPEIIEAPVGTRADAVGKPGIDLYALTHNETSTGVIAPILRPAGADGDAIVAVDATSAAGGVMVDPSQFDCYYFAPQKCFGADAGLWLALCSPAAIERIERIKASGRWTPAVLDLSQAITNSRANQTLNTPAISTLILLADQIDWMLGNGGLSWAASRSEKSASTLYGWAESANYATPFVAQAEHRSPVVGTVDIDGFDAGHLCDVLRANGVLDTDSYRKLGRNQIRVGMFPAVEPDDVAALTATIDYIAERLL